ncbi:MAG TPA: nucleoside triphosphate pyrophosphohydrolase [Terriglobales bacterium]|nr:nucleoside triphosphate pyrophosphohydrolase [Terriglobales bacterium]
MNDIKTRLVANYGGKYNFDDFVELVRVLRSPGGCPWDREQTHASIRKNFIEETYEVCEAIDTCNTELLCEELGDVLLQVGLHTEMEREAGRFGYEDVITGLCRKLILRHPHVFGEVKADTSEEVLTNWDAIKMNTKGYTTQTQSLRSVPAVFPALMRAQKLQKKAAKVGFDWPDAEGALQKLEEEIAELREAVAAGQAPDIKAELGDMLFSAVNVVRKLKCDAEELLTSASEKFVDRFEQMEQAAISGGHALTELGLTEMDRLWDDAKHREGGASTAVSE